MTAHRRVLVVDADPDGRQRTVDALADRGDDFAVTGVATHDAALDAVAEDSVDCVVSAYHLDDATGLDLLEAVRERDPALPVVLFTDDGDERIASEAIAADVTDYLGTHVEGDRYAALAECIEDAVSTYHARAGLRESEQELRHKSEMLDRILEHVPLHIYIKDDQASHIWVSDYYTGSNEQLGKTDAEYFDQDWAEETYEEDLAVIETGEPVIKDVRHDPSQDAWVLNSKVPWYDEDGQVIGLVGATWDITERHEAKLQLERQTERLEKFLTALSHDMRNPLQLASSRLALARETGDDEHLESVDRAHDRMEQLIEETLTMAREGETVTETESVDLGEVVARSWETIETDSATLSVQTDGTVEADPDRLQRLFDNLFANSITHGVSDGETLTVTVAATDEGFFVADDGEGVPPDERDDVFEVGYTTAAEGTGFGLAMVEEIAEAHGWSISLTESESGGAKFVVDTGH